MALKQVNAGHHVPDNLNVIIEISAHSEPVKYEVDKETGAIFVDRFMATSMRYPCDYGYIPNTLSEDGDPVDVLAINPLPVNHGTVVRCRPIGMLSMEDESGVDTKILAVPVDSLTTLYRHVHSLDDLPAPLLDQIKHFFEHYKDLEPNKWVKVMGWGDREMAKQEIMNSIARFEAAEENA